MFHKGERKSIWDIIGYQVAKSRTNSLISGAITTSLIDSYSFTSLVTMACITLSFCFFYKLLHQADVRVLYLFPFIGYCFLFGQLQDELSLVHKFSASLSIIMYFLMKHTVF